MAKKIDTDKAAEELATNLNRLPHPDGRIMRMVMFDSESEAVVRLKRDIAESIIAFLVGRGYMEAK